MMWREEWDAIVRTVAASGAAAAVVGAARIVISYRYDGWAQWLAVLCGSVFVGVVAALIVSESALGPGWAGAVVALCAFLADNLILALLTVAKAAGTDPIRTLRRLMAAWRGQRPPDDTDKPPLGPK